MTAPVKRYHPNHPHIDGRDVVLASDYERLEQENSDLRLQCGGMEMDIDELREQIAKIIDIDLGIYPQSVTGGDNPYTERTGYMDGWNDHSIQHSQAVEAIFKGEEPESVASKQLAACVEELDKFKRAWAALRSEWEVMRKIVATSLDYFTEAGIPEDLLVQYRSVLQAKKEETPNAN